MRFLHEDPEFGDLVLLVARERGIGPGLVEKDYQVTHALWSLAQQGFEVWFKGGTSLSKGLPRPAGGGGILGSRSMLNRHDCARLCART